jgi:hypothetical protein
MTMPFDRSASEGEERRFPSSGCELFDSVAAELALGSLTGAERSAALSHLDECDNCRILIKELSATADALLLAAPEADPPPGFEVRLLARLGRGEAAVVHAPSRHRASVLPGRWRARAVLAAAAAAVAIAAAGIGVGVTVAPHHATPTAASRARVATLLSVRGANAAATPVGEVAITAGKPPWVVMSFKKPGYSGWVYCVVSEHGQSRVLGSFWMHDGSASWAVALASSAASVSSAQIEGLNGAVFATAHFAS